MSLRSLFASRRWPVLVIFGLLCALHLLFDLKNHRFTVSDFAVYHRAAVRALAGENLYRHVEDGFFEYKYAPTAAFLFAPFALLPLQAAKVAYWLFLSVIVPINLFLCYRIARPRWRDEPAAPMNRALLFAGLAIAPQIIRELHLGNANPALLFSTLLAICFYLDGRAVAFAIAGAASIFLKPFALAFAPYLMLKRRWSELALLLAAIAALAVAPALRYGIDGLSNQYRGYRARLGEAMAPNADLLAQGTGNHTLASLAARYTPLRIVAGEPGAARAIQLGAAIALALMVLWFVLRGRALERPEAGDFALLLLLPPLLVYGAFAGAALAAIVLLLKFQHLAGWRWLVAAGLVLLGMNLYDLWGRRLHALFEAWSLAGVGAVLLATALVAGRARRQL